MAQQRTAWIVGASLILLVAVGAGEARGQMFVPTGRDTLRGLPGVEVVVEVVSPEVERAGLTGASIRTSVLRQLQENGVRVFATQADNPSPAKPYLYVHLNALELPAGGGYVTAIQVHLRQTVQSMATSSHIVNAMTWDAHNIVVAPASALQSVREEIAGCVELFLRDWAATR